MFGVNPKNSLVNERIIWLDEPKVESCFDEKVTGAVKVRRGDREQRVTVRFIK